MAEKTHSLLSIIGKLLLTGLVLLLATIIYLDAWVIEKFNDRKWALPATVYARPLELYAGHAISQQAVIRELQAMHYRQNRSGQPPSFYQQGRQLVIFSQPFIYWDGPQPARRIGLHFDNYGISNMRSSASGEAIVRLPPMEIGKIHAHTREDRLLVSLDDVPPHLIQALLATEDRDFFQHRGISLRGLGRAAIANLREGRVSEGGSTLTQQLVKNFFLHNRRSYSRKLLEAMLAVVLEWRADKQAILEAYINEVYVAQDGARGIHGFGLASQYLFGKPLADLELHQTALLVAMMKGPSYYNPLRHPERARQRRNLVLSLMAQQGMIDDAEAQNASEADIAVGHHRQPSASYPAYLDLVRRQLQRDYNQQALTTEGLRVFTNMDPQWQWHSQKSLQQGVAGLELRNASAEGMDGGAVVINHATGDVLAIVGSRNPRIAGFNRALDAQRPIGSLIKPAVYLTALEQGYHLASPLSDQPLEIKSGGQLWQPQNFDRKFREQVPLYLALSHSYNIATARLGMDLGLDTVSETVKRLGVERRPPQVPALLLGAFELSPLEVAQMYSTIAANGFYMPLRSIREITDHQGNALQRYALRLERRIQAEHRHLIDYALQTVMHEGTGRAVQGLFPKNSIIAGKTGTTNDQRDSWFAGYDSNRLAVVWLGHDDNRALPVTGSSGALPIWANILQHNHPPKGATIVPDDIHYLWVDKISGKISDESCENAAVLPFIKNTEPQQVAQCTPKRQSIRHWFRQWFSTDKSAN